VASQREAGVCAALRNESRQGRRCPELTERFIESLESAAGAEDSTGPELPAPSARPKKALAEPLAAVAAADLQ